jgi:tetratricopeptide (TPR) repeat protein
MKLSPDKWIKFEQQRRDIMARYAQDNHAAAACEAMRRLAAKAAMLPGVQADLMKLAWAVCEFSTALTAAGKLLALAPAQPAAVQAAADLFLLCGQPDKARAAWLRLEKSPQNHAAWLGLSSLAERAGRMDEAAEWSAKALANNPKDAQSRIRAGCIARRQGRMAEAAAYLEPCSAPGVPPAIRASALYELGELHDKANDPASAVAAWREAKRCMEQAWPSQVTLARRVRAKAIDQNRRLVSDLTPEPIRRWRSQPLVTDIPPVVILAGHPRSGTTLLEQVLAAHPDILDIDEKDAMACALRETLFPAAPGGPELTALDNASGSPLAAVRKDYLRRLAMLGSKPGPGSVILDKNPNFTDLLPFLLRPFPGLRLVVARRDPRDVLLSCYRLPVVPESGNVGWLREEDAVADYVSMMSVWERLRDCLGDETGWMEIRYEDLCHDLEHHAASVTRFTGLEWHPAQAVWQDTGKDRHVASPSYEAVRTPVHTASIGKWQRYTDHLPELFRHFE